MHGVLNANMMQFQKIHTYTDAVMTCDDNFEIRLLGTAEQVSKDPKRKIGGKRDLPISQSKTTPRQ